MQHYRDNVRYSVLQHWRTAVVVSDMGRCRIVRAALLRIAAHVHVSRVSREHKRAARTHWASKLLSSTLRQWREGVAASLELDMLLTANVLRRKAERALTLWFELANSRRLQRLRAVFILWKLSARETALPKKWRRASVTAT